MTGKQVESGMVVLTSDDQTLGQVKRLLGEGQYFQVDCRMAPDYYVPIDAVAVTEGKTVRLRLSKHQATNAGWELKPKS